MQDLQNAIQEQLSALLVDPSPVVKRAILHNISALCIFLGKQRTNDVLLSHMITYLNDRDWLLRFAFFDSIVDVAACAGGRSLEDYILPLMIQALSGMYISGWYTNTDHMLRRCRRNRGCDSSCVSSKLMRAGIVPKDANLGAAERHAQCRREASEEALLTGGDRPEADVVLE